MVSAIHECTSALIKNKFKKKKRGETSGADNFWLERRPITIALFDVICMHARVFAEERRISALSNAFFFLKKKPVGIVGIAGSSLQL